MRFDIMSINVVFSMVSSVLVLYYLNCNNVEFNKNRSVAFIIIFGIINGTLSTKMAGLGNLANTVKPVLLLGLSILIIKYILNIKLKKATIVFCLLMVGMGIGNAVGLLAIGPFIKGNIPETIQSNALFYTCTNFIVAVVTIVFLRLINPINGLIKQIINSKELAITLLFTFLIIIANAGLYYYVEVFNLTAFIFITFLTLAYCTYAIINSASLYKRELGKAEREQQEFYNKSLEDSLFNMRRFRHDWNNNMSVLNSMLEMNKVSEASKYLHEMMEFNMVHANTSYFGIKNAGLFGIVSSKQNKARELGIDLDITGIGEIKDIPGIKVSELCEVIGILLDNAIEESVSLKDNVEMIYSDTEKNIEISIKNKCKSDIDLSKFGNESSKGEGHGNGLKIVERIIGKYKNISNFRSFENDDKIFEQLIVIEKGL